MLWSPNISQVCNLFGATVSHSVGVQCNPQCNPHQEGPSSGACPALAHGWRPALVPKSQQSLLRTTTVVLYLLLSIHHWYLPFKHFSLNTFSTYQRKWLCASLSYTMKLERLSLDAGGGTDRLLSPVQQFCFGKTVW